MKFTRELLCMRTNAKPKKGNCGGGVRFDIYDIHPYTTGSPAHEGGVNDVQLGYLGKLKALLRAADRAGRIKGRFRRTPLWATELNHLFRPSSFLGAKTTATCRPPRDLADADTTTK